MSPQATFAQLGLSPEILKAIDAKGFKTPSPIQAQVIPLLLNGKKDIIGQAQTGTGKTAAFALPLLEKVDASKKETQAIILTPTRELAIQVAKEIESFQVSHSPSVAVFYGGNPMRFEVKALKNHPNIVVGTPGRIQHHIRHRNLNLEKIRYFVLDEADEMLNFGFREEIESILAITPPQRRVLLFSATLSQNILRIAQNYMGDYQRIKVTSKEMTNENITQKYYCIHPRDKFDALCRIMENEESFYAIVFCRTKLDTDFVASRLMAQHLRAAAIHGDIDQSQREKILKRFREQDINILVATDVAARGIDINDLNFVVNYSLPESYEAYTHRIGRTGRAGNKGTAITLVTGREMNRLRFFERNLNVKLQKGQLPSPKELISKKKQHLIERIEHILNNEPLDYLSPLAKQLLEEGNAEEVVTALLKDAYQNDLNPHSYRIIPDDERSSPPAKSTAPQWRRGRRNASGYKMRQRKKFGGKPGGARQERFKGGKRGFKKKRS